MTYWLNVSYSSTVYDIDSADVLIFGALGLPADAEHVSGAGFHVRDLHFPYATLEEADAALRRLLSAGLPMGFEAAVGEIR